MIIPFLINIRTDKISDIMGNGFMLSFEVTVMIPIPDITVLITLFENGTNIIANDKIEV